MKIGMKKSHFCENWEQKGLIFMKIGPFYWFFSALTHWFILSGYPIKLTRYNSPLSFSFLYDFYIIKFTWIVSYQFIKNEKKFSFCIRNGNFFSFSNKMKSFFSFLVGKVSFFSFFDKKRTFFPFFE